MKSWQRAPEIKTNGMFRAISDAADVPIRKNEAGLGRLRDI
jgi:hypothetical protein